MHSHGFPLDFFWSILSIKLVPDLKEYRVDLIDLIVEHDGVQHFSVHIEVVWLKYFQL